MKRHAITLFALILLVALTAFFSYATAPSTLVSLPASGIWDAPVTSYDAAQYNAINAAIALQNANNALFATTPVGTSQLDPTTVQYATVNLTLTQLLALNASGVTLLAAPGSGKFVEFLGGTFEYVAGSAAFTIGSATNLTVNYTNGSGAAASVARAATGFFDQSTSQLSNLEKITTNITGASSTLLNSALTLNLAAADMTVGTGATGIFKFAYRVHSGF